MSGLPGTVVGALIAGGFAIIGGGLTALNTRATLRANRQASQDQRYWEKKTELYEEAYRTTRLRDLIARMEEEPTADFGDYLPDFEAIMEELAARMTFYSSKAV